MDDKNELLSEISRLKLLAGKWHELWEEQCAITDRNSSFWRKRLQEEINNSIHTTFKCGDKAYCIVGGKDIRELTIGSVRTNYTDSPGCGEDNIFDNYKPHKYYKEEYMCIETGVDSGSVYTIGKNIFKTEIEAKSAIEASL